MSATEAREALEKLAQIAARAGISVELDEDRMLLVAGFNIGDGRSQVLYVRYSGTTFGNQRVATFFSPCLSVKKGFMRGISRNQAVDLLVRNDNLMFARYGVWRGDGEDMIVASVDQLIDTLDPNEFKAHALCVSSAADTYEKEHGGDEF